MLKTRLVLSNVPDELDYYDVKRFNTPDELFQHIQAIIANAGEL